MASRLFDLQRCVLGVDRGFVTVPRQIHRGMTFYLTVRSTNRSFRFVPTAAVVDSVRFVLAVVSERYRVEHKLALHEFCFMSNHFHILGTDHEACLPEFLRDFNALLSRQLNALRGSQGTNIEKGAGVLEVQCEERIVEHAIYTLANPVAAFLVAEARRWPGASSLTMEYGAPVAVPRPNCGLWVQPATSPNASAVRSGRARFAGRTKFSGEAFLEIERPDVMVQLCDAELRRYIREKLMQREKEIQRDRLERGKRVMGARAVRSAHYLQVPGAEALFARNPTFSASSQAESARLARRHRLFVLRYRAAAEAFFAGCRETVFPEGTYLWRRRFGVACEPLQSG